MGRHKGKEGKRWLLFCFVGFLKAKHPFDELNHLLNVLSDFSGGRMDNLRRLSA